MKITNYKGFLSMDSHEFTLNEREYIIISTHTHDDNSCTCTIKDKATGEYFEYEHQELCQKLLNLQK